ncbi:HAT family dimerization protein, partial [Rhizoctonia solani AG-3 Rhs1AP]
MSQPPPPGAFPLRGYPHHPGITSSPAAPLSAQSSLSSIHVPEADSMIPIPLASHVGSQAVPPTSEQPIAVPTTLQPSPANPGPKKRKRKANSKTTEGPNTDRASSRNAVCEQNVEARLSALETLADVCETPPPTMRAPPPPSIEPCLSDARDIWFHQYPVKTKPLKPLTRSEVDALILIVKQYQANLIFDQIQHPGPESEAMLCACCLYDGITKAFMNRGGGITGGIRDHLKKVHPVAYYTKCMQEGLSEHCIDMSPDLLNGGQPKFTLDGFLDRLVRWMVVDDQAFNLLEIPEFRDLMLYATQGLLKDSELPHRDKLELLAYGMYRTEKDLIDKDMQSSRGSISLTSDLWSDIRIRSFMAVTVHYIDALGTLRDHLIAFRKLNGHHTGVNIAHALHEVLQESGLVDKLGYITPDNASNNNTAMTELAVQVQIQEQFDTFHPEWNRIRCFPHILNLAVQSILKSLRVSAAKYREYMEKHELAVSPATEGYLNAMESDPVEAVRGSIAACRSSGTRREEFEKAVQKGNEDGTFKLPNGQVIQLPNLQLLRDSPTRWGSTFLMMERYEIMSPAVRDFAFHMRYDVLIPVITHKEFEVIQDLTSVLRIPHNAQELLSSEKTPTLALAVPLYESIIWTWEQFAVAIPELSHAISCGIDKLQDYIGLARNVPAHILAMFINPTIKLTWVHDHWGPSAEAEAEEMIIAEMLKVQQTRPPPPSAHSTSSARQATHAQNSGYLHVITAGVDFRRASDLQNPNSETSSLATPEPTNPAQFMGPETIGPSAYEVEQRNRQIVLEEYRLYVKEALAGGEKLGSVDLVQYWVNHQYTYPNLYQIAMNILPAQASSVSSERVFSSSKLTMTAERSRLSASNMEYLQVLKHALRRRRRDVSNGINVDADGLDFISHLFGEISVDDSDRECLSST